MTPRQIAFLFSFPANSKSLPAHAPATNNRTVCRNHFNPYLFIYKLYCFLLFLNPLEERRRRWENEVIWKSHHRRRRACCLHNGFDEVRESWRRRAMCVLRVCVLGRPVCVFAWLFGYEIFTQKRGEKNPKPALLLLLPSPSCLYKRVTLKDWERKRRRGTHSRRRGKKKDFFKNLK